MASEETQCTSFACDTVGLIITVLQVGQFVPQHVEMAVDRSTAGLSPWLLFFGSLYTYLAFLDIALTDTPSVFTCGDGAYRCFVEAQPWIQMALSAVLSSALWYWFLKYHREPEPGSAEAHISQHGSLAHTFYDLLPPKTYFQANVVIVILITLRAYVLYTGDNPEKATAFAHMCGNVAAALNAVMWIPQIVVTASFGHKGALSIYWVIASIVMDVAYSIYLAAMGLDMSVWLNNVPDGIQTSVLLAIILYYQRQDNLRGTDEFGRRKSRIIRRQGEGDALLKKTSDPVGSALSDIGYETVGGSV